MQKTWRNDEDSEYSILYYFKIHLFPPLILELTFIILDKAKLSESHGDEIEAMVGDTNLFLSQDQDSDQLLGEIEIMIAEGAARGKGFGWEATCTMLKYGMDVLKVGAFVAKIGLDNATSIRMFEKLQFKEESRSAVFNEITFTRACDPTMSEFLEKAVPGGKLNLQEIATYPADESAADR